MGGTETRPAHEARRAIPAPSADGTPDAHLVRGGGDGAVASRRCGGLRGPEMQVGNRTLSGILEHIALDGAVVLSHEGGVLASDCFGQEVL
jgi:hypothetical protein